MNERSSTTTSRSRETAVVSTFVELADTLTSDYDVVEVMDHLVHTCVDVLGLQLAGMLLQDRRTGTLAVAASSSASMRVMEVFQVQHSEGPCPDCVHGGETVTSDDLTQELRWPSFVPLALDAGCLSVTAVPLRWRGQHVGALGLFHGRPGPLPGEDRALAQAFADAAAISLMQQQVTHEREVVSGQLRAALDSRVAIEQAKGVLAERGQLDMKQAFEQLRSHARNNNLKLAAVARAVVEGELVLPA